MENLKQFLPYPLLIGFFFIGHIISIRGQDDCNTTPPFDIKKPATVPATGCKGLNCDLTPAQAAARDAKVATVMFDVDIAAAKVCAAKACPANQNCQAAPVHSPFPSVEFCSVDTTGHYFCTDIVKGEYRCACTENQVSVNASNPTGNYCTGGYLELFATTTTPIPNPKYIQWFINDTVLAGATLPSLIVNSPGIYEVLIADADGNLFLSAPFHVQCFPAIPTLKQWGIIILAALLVIPGILFLIPEKSRLIGGS